MKIERWWGDKNLIDFLKLIDERGFVMRREQKIYTSTLGFYLAIRFLKERGIIQCDGMDETQMKKWVLSERGKLFIRHIKSIEGLLNVEV